MTKNKKVKKKKKQQANYIRQKQKTNLKKKMQFINIQNSIYVYVLYYDKYGENDTKKQNTQQKTKQNQ